MGNRFYLTFENFFFVSLIAYTVFPVVDCILNEKRVNYIVPFITSCIIIVLAMIFGYLIGDKMSTRFVLYKDHETITNSALSQLIWTAFWGALCVWGFIYTVLKNRGGFESFFTAGYRQSYVANSSSTIAALMYAAAPFALVFTNDRIISNKKARIFAFIISIAISFLYFMGGNRNQAILILIALIWSKFRKNSFNKLFVYASIIIIIVALNVVAVFREYGVANILAGNISLDWSLVWKYSFGFSDGEIGTMYKFFEYKDRISTDFKFPYSYGYSYFILPVINLVPSIIWKSKPMVYSNYFSHHAFGGFKGIGYGFFPIYEAQINFGFFWPIVFVIWGYFLSKNKTKSESVGINKYLNVGLLTCLVLNIWRIDFSTLFKFYAMMWVYKKIYLFTLNVNIGNLSIIYKK